MPIFKIEHTHTITDIYFVNSESLEDAENSFLNGELEYPNESLETDEPDTYGITDVTEEVDESVTIRNEQLDSYGDYIDENDEDEW